MGSGGGGCLHRGGDNRARRAWRVLWHSLDSYIPASARTGEIDEDWKLRLLLHSSLLLGLLLLSLFVLLFSQIGFSVLTVTVAWASVLALSNPVLLRYTGSKRLFGAVIPFVLLAMDGAIATDQYGLLSMLVGWNAIIPLIAVLFVGARFGLFCLAVVLAQLLTFAHLNTNLEVSASNLWIPEFMQAAFAWGFALIYERTRAKATTLIDDARRDALEANRAKSEFMATMSHELRTPMNGVVGISELLLDTPLSDDQWSLAMTVHTSALALVKSIDDVMNISRLELKQQILEDSAFLLDRALRHTCAQVRRDLPEGRVLRESFQPSLAAAVRGDERRLRQVLRSLLYHCIETSDAGEIGLEGSVTSDSTGASLSLKLHLSCQSTSLNSQALEALFEPFYYPEQGNAVGLELSLVGALVRAMDGDISAWREGDQTHYVAQLRLAMCTRSARALGGDSKPRVLLVDDNPVNRKVGRGLLTQLGCEVTLADDGQQALAALTRGHFDLVFMDCLMPVMDGFEATEAIRAHLDPAVRRLPVFALTASAMPADHQRCLAVGMDEVFLKPATRDLMQRALGLLGCPGEAPREAI